MTRARTLPILAAALVALALFTAAAPAPAGTTIPDATYGEGGTKESVSNDQHVLLGEIWRDKNGIIREQVELDADGAQYWGFFIGEGTSTYAWGGAIAIRPIGGPNARWQMTIYGTGTVTVKEYGFLTKDELDTEFAHWHSQMRGWINGFLKPA